MGKYLIKRLIKGLLSCFAVLAIVMVLIYTLMNKDLVLKSDETYNKSKGNAKKNYKYYKLSEYGYYDYVNYTDYIAELYYDGEITQEQRQSLCVLANKRSQDSDEVKAYEAKFEEIYTELGYDVYRLEQTNTIPGKYMFAVREKPLLTRFVTYIGNIIQIDSVRKADGIAKEDRYIKLVWRDPVYGGEKFSPCIIGNGTEHKYLLYFDNSFPYIHQNLITIKLGTSYSVDTGVDVFESMTRKQGSYNRITTLYPSGLVLDSPTSDDLHSATYSRGSWTECDPVVNKRIYERYTDDYTIVSSYRTGKSRMGYSFTIGIIATILAYVLGIPLGLVMARHKDGLLDKLGTVYIIFIIAVPSLAYIFMFQTIGSTVFKLPSKFDLDLAGIGIYILPIISLALPSMAGLMKWCRRYMIDQMNSDYVKFARSSGLSEKEIFSKHILKNAIIPTVHGIPGSLLGALTGAIITESVYTVPGVGNVLTNAISAYDNSVIVGVTLFYAILSVVSLILGDLLMAAVDPRISFADKGR